MTGLLSHSPADIVRYILIGKTLATLPTDASAWPSYVSKEPDTPDNCITIFDTEDVLEGRFMTSGQKQQHEGFQIRIRSVNYSTGHSKCRSIVNTLDTDVLRYDLTIDSIPYRIQSITRLSGILHLGDESPSSKRQLFTINGSISVRKLS